MKLVLINSKTKHKKGATFAFQEVDLNCATNNKAHHTSSISVNQLIVRRGQPFNITLKMTEPFNPDSDQLTMKVVTGKHPSQEQGTMSSFGFPDKVKRSSRAKAVWRAELQENSLPETGTLALTITPPADAPVGEYKLSAGLKAEEKELAQLFVLFNPWCSDDWVFLPNEAERQEYVMNQHGIIYTGSDHHINGLSWDFGQFEEDMVKICLKLLDLSRKHKQDPADDVSARCNPIYVSRVMTNMVNKDQMNDGVLRGNWSGDFKYGFPPTHWSGSYAILKQWYASFCKAVNYGQCWVFAGVLCSVMRLLGIPCRVVTNFESAHDSNANLTIDTYYGEFGVRPKKSNDSVWNFHVWVEGWMRRPDLGEDRRYDGWQVLDGTPQEKSEGVFCCGPAPVAAILNGDVDLKYDVPFVFAEVNADRVTWLVKGGQDLCNSDTRSVGQYISTKAVGSNRRMDITSAYKYTEGEQTDTPDTILSMHYCGAFYSPCCFNSPTGAFRHLCGPPHHQGASKSTSLWKSLNLIFYLSDLTIPIQIPYITYSKYMVDCQTMNISAMITDLQNDETFLAANRVVLKDPPITITVSDEARVNQILSVLVTFMNPISETLTDCSLTLSGTGLIDWEQRVKLEDLMPNKKMCVELSIVPYRSGERTLLADFDCAAFRDIKTSCVINVRP
uniref:protein-glutamine gamma-glutamyltransferase n=1 Tax=Poecilia mexicana TaxID=48701 RepID=A0A3B3YSH4_9TELE